MFLTCLICCIYIISPVKFNNSVLSDTLWPHGLQHTRTPCPWPTLEVCSNSGPSSRWCHPTILSSVVLFSACLQSLPASGSFEWVSSLHQVAKVLEFQLQHQSFQWILRTHYFRTDWSDLLEVQGIFKSLLQHQSSKASILQHPTFFMVQLSHPYTTIGKTIAWTRQTFVGKVMSLLPPPIYFYSLEAKYFTILSWFLT